MFEVRIWVPIAENGANPWQVRQAFEGYQPIYLDDREMLWVPAMPMSQENDFREVNLADKLNMY